MTDHDHHAAANAEQVRRLQEALAQPPSEHERPPAWNVPAAAALWGAGLLGQWLVWHDPGALALFGIVAGLNVAALAWWVWGPE